VSPELSRVKLEVSFTKLTNLSVADPRSNASFHVAEDGDMLVKRRTFVPGRELARRLQLSWAFPLLAAITARLSVPSLTADFSPGSAPAFSDSLPALSWTGLYIGGHVGTWFAPTNPGYEAIGFPSASFDLLPEWWQSACGCHWRLAGGLQLPDRLVRAWLGNGL
jgi:hypothetical protein